MSHHSLLPNQVPGPFLNVVELIVESLDGMVVSSMGPKKALMFRNYVSALFLFILTCNLSGLLGLRPPQPNTVNFVSE